MRYDEGKLRFDLVPQIMIDELAKVFTYGSRKYADHNWAKGMSWSRVYGSAMRHLGDFRNGTKIDHESNLHVLAHAAWNVLVLMVYDMMGIGVDDLDWSVASEATVASDGTILPHGPTKVGTFSNG